MSFPSLQQTFQTQLQNQSKSAMQPVSPLAQTSGTIRPSNDFLQSPEEFPPLGASSLLSQNRASSFLASSQSQATGQQSSSPSSSLSSNSLDKYGLTGLLSVIRMTDQDLNALALGFDLTTLGLNLNSPEYLYTTFASPWSENSTRVQPEFRIPQCYFMNPPHLRFQMFQRFHPETLFYIFYSMPCDVLQLAAAQELYNREWRFHKEKKLWLTRVPNSDPVVKTATYEKGSYLMFDPEKWEKIRKDDFVLVYDQLEEKTTVQTGEQPGQTQQVVADLKAKSPAAVTSS